MENNEKYYIHPLVRAYWSDGKAVLERMDLGQKLTLETGIQGVILLHNFAEPAIPAEVASKLGANEQVLIFIETLKKYGILVAADGAVGRTLPFDIQAVDDGTFNDIHTRCMPYTMGDVYMNYALFQAVRYIATANIKGDLVETGVWKGGSAMICALTLLHFGVTDRKIYLYDSFDFTWPGYSEHDAQIYGRDNEKTGAMVDNLQKKAQLAQTGQEEPLLTLEEVRKNVASTGYPIENLVFVKGYVQETIPAKVPKQVALLRLDTDFYESTLHELQHLYPLISKGGVLLIDDYPTEAGATLAADQYFEGSEEDILLHRIGIQGRIGVRV